MNLEYYSSLALVTSAVVYMLALFAHAAEWAAAGRMGLRTEPSVELVGASAGAAGAWHSRVLSLSKAACCRQCRRRGRPERVEQFGRIGVALTVIGFLLSVTGVVLRGLAAGRAPWGNMFEFTISAMVFVVGVYLVMVWRAGVRWLGLPVTLLAAIGNGLAVTVFYVAVAPLVPALHSVWFVIHIVAAAISGAAFNIGGLLSILYLVKQRAEERGTVRGYLGWCRARGGSTCWRTGSSPSPSRCGPSPSPPARSGPSTPGAATGAGTPRRPGPWSPG